MTSEEGTPRKHRTEIIVAVISLVAAVASAVIANWDKIVASDPAGQKLVIEALVSGADEMRVKSPQGNSSERNKDRSEPRDLSTSSASTEETRTSLSSGSDRGGELEIQREPRDNTVRHNGTDTLADSSLGEEGPSGPLSVEGEVVPPVKLGTPPPEYTEEAQQARIEGRVLVEATIDSRGEVVDVEVVEGLPLGLTESAVQTIRTWRFKPATLNGSPVPVYYRLAVNFSLE